MVDPLSILRLAVRIEGLQRTNTHGWRGDELEFRNLLPTGRDHRKLPDPVELRKKAQDNDLTMNQMQFWNGIAMRLEGMAQDNDPRNPRRMIQDMARGKMPGMR